MVDPNKLETGLRTISAGIPHTLYSQGLRLLGFQLLGLCCIEKIRAFLCLCEHLFQFQKGVVAATASRRRLELGLAAVYLKGAGGSGFGV